MKRMASVGDNSRSNGSSTGRRRQRTPMRGETRYVLCVKNKGYRASLELGKLYRCIRDRDAEQHLMRRVVDESGEDYLYPCDWFIEIRLPPAAKRALSSISA
jgi:hypothetical protein